MSQIFIVGALAFCALWGGDKVVHGVKWTGHKTYNGVKWTGHQVAKPFKD